MSYDHLLCDSNSLILGLISPQLLLLWLRTHSQLHDKWLVVPVYLPLSNKDCLKKHHSFNYQHSCLIKKMEMLGIITGFLSLLSLSPLAWNLELYFSPLLHIHCHYQLWIFGSPYPHLMTVQWSSPHLLWLLLYEIQELLDIWGIYILILNFSLHSFAAFTVLFLLDWMTKWLCSTQL